MTYDYLDRRTSLTTAAGTTYFHYVGADVVAETDEEGDVTAAYTYGPVGLLSMTRGGETYFYQRNAHGDVVSLTDDTGAVVNTYTYDPWGKLLASSEQVPNPYRYAGYRYDSATGLYYLWHRYYDAGVRRFVTLDLIGGMPSNTQSLNLYVYVRNTPANLIDPTGLDPRESADLLASGYRLPTGREYPRIPGGPFEDPTWLSRTSVSWLRALILQDPFEGMEFFVDVNFNAGFFGGGFLINHTAEGGFNFNGDDMNGYFGPSVNTGGVSLMLGPGSVQDGRWYYEGNLGVYYAGGAYGTGMQTSFGPRIPGTTYWESGASTPGGGFQAFYVF